LERLPRVGLGQRFLCEIAQALEALGRQCLDQVVLGREVPVDGPDADAGRARDLVDPCVQAVARETSARSLDDQHAVPTRVAALADDWSCRKSGHFVWS